MEEQIIERYGSIVKEENLWYRNEIGSQNSCILEAIEPFPGYYGQVLHEVKPKLIYLITKTEYSLEDILRATKVVKNTFPGINIATSQITMAGDTLSAIRIKNIENYDEIKPIQEIFTHQDIKFDVKKRNATNTPAIIKTNKFFKFIEYTGQDVFMDVHNSNNGYFSIPTNIDWQTFKKIILYIKHNHHDFYFDAARGCIFNFLDITDIVRIYTKNNNFTLTNRLKNIFLNRI